MLLSSAQELPSFTLSLSSIPTTMPNRSKAFTFPKPSALALLRHRHLLLRTISIVHPSPYLSLSVSNPRRWAHLLPLSNTSDSSTTLIEQLAGGEDGVYGYDENLDFCRDRESEMLDFEGSFVSTDLRHFKSPSLEVIELEELPEQWRRSRLAWLCKELPAHKSKTVTRVLNAQRKWIRQEDATYLVVHCMRIRVNDAGFRVYKWMIQQHWFQFDFALATKLADYLGKERKYLKCREIFNDIINQGRVPSESTFHILIIAYLSSSARGCLEEACGIYNRMIQLGGYKPRLSLHNALFRALVSKPGGSAKYYLRQAEFIFHNLVTSRLDIHKDIYGGLIWLHSYQAVIDKGRIASLRAEMEFAGIEESKEVLVSILRACSKEGDVEEAETTWIKLVESGCSLSSQAYVHRLEVYAKVGDPLKSLEIFREMQQQLGSASVVAYHKIIEILCKAQKMELAQQLMTEFMASDMKPLMPSFIELMKMYLKSGLHDKLEETFLRCLEKCSPNRTIYTLYLESLVQSEHLDKAEEIFHQMYSDGSIGVNTHSCNTILGGYLSCDECVKAEKIYDLMCQKKFDIESTLKEKLDHVLSLRRTAFKKPTSLVLSKEQREILIGLLLGGLPIESDDERRNHAVCFEFDENDRTHSVLKRHLFDQYLEWLASFCRPTDDSDNIPCHFATISHSYFKFYADQFRPNGQPVIPKLIHRWLSPRVLAYWYMYGGYKTSSGDFLLKVMGSQEGIKKIVKVLKTKSLDCRVKRKGKVFWIGFLGSNATRFWTLIEPFIIYDLKDSLKAGGQSLKGVLTRDITFDSGSESDEKTYDYSEDDNL